MNQLLIIDGSSMLTTNYFATLPKSVMFEKDAEKQKEHFCDIMHAKDGTYTNAIYGTLKMIKKIIEKQSPSHIAVVFDQTRDTFRRELYPDYKGQRSETQLPLKQQFVLMEQILDEIGIKTFYSTEYEADDYAGSLARKFESPDTRVYLLTKDHDYLQLVSCYTRLWLMQSTKDKTDALYNKYYNLYAPDEKFNLPDKVFEFTPDLVKAEFGVYPAQIPDLKGLCGDSSDNIPGVKGIAEKSAIPLLVEYGSIEKLYNTIRGIPLDDKKAIKEVNTFWKELGITRSPFNALLQTYDESRKDIVGEKAATLSKKLATIVCNIPLTCTLDDLIAELDYNALQNVCNRLDIQKL